MPFYITAPNLLTQRSDVRAQSYFGIPFSQGGTGVTGGTTGDSAGSRGNWEGNRWCRVEPTAPVPATEATPDGCSGSFLAIAGIVVFVGVNGDRAGGTDQALSTTPVPPPGNTWRPPKTP